MPLQITARNTVIQDGDRKHIETKVERFRRLAVGDQISTLDVVVSMQKNLYTVEVILKASRFDAAGRAKNSDLRTAIDDVMAKVERQLRKQIEKKRTQKRHPREGLDRHTVTLNMSFAGGASTEAEDTYCIYRTKRIATKPMSVEEAAAQLDIEAGAFMVFTNPETDRINILYRRDDGDFGVIEPS